MFSRLALLIAIIFTGFCGIAQTSWPKEITTPAGGKLVIYQPLPENLTVNKLTGRSAVFMNKNSSSEPIFGAIFFQAKNIYIGHGKSQ